MPPLETMRPSFLKSNSFWVALTAATGLKVDEAMREKALAIGEDLTLSPASVIIGLIVIAYIFKRGHVDASRIKANALASHGLEEGRTHAMVKALHGDLEEKLTFKITDILSRASAAYDPTPYAPVQVPEGVGKNSVTGDVADLPADVPEPVKVTPRVRPRRPDERTRQPKPMSDTSAFWQAKDERRHSQPPQPKPMSDTSAFWAPKDIS